MVRRDIHALAVLFIMPMAFILIMSLSLQSTMDSSAEIRPEIGLWIENINEPLKNKVEKLEGFKIRTYHDKKEAIGSAKRDEIKAVISIPDNANSITNGKNRKANNEPRIRIYIAPSTSYQLRQLIHVSLASLLSAEKINELVSRQKPTKTDPNKLYSELIKTQELFERQGEKAQPTSVQQSVPAWLIFSMFFVVIPIATTFIVEQQQGTLQRLKSYPIPGSLLLLGKLIPYMGINLIQTFLMFMVGIYLVPLLGGDALQLPEHPLLLLPISIAISVTAISFALLVATLVKTTEQATTIGGISNLLLGAIGGIMVPTFIMPEIMQTVARFSPMNWGLEGYLDILLRQGGLEDTLPEIGKLLLLAAVLFLMALYFYRKKVVN
jgi:ABC-2 type transport system permease protein